jgi:putative hemolysin
MGRSVARLLGLDVLERTYLRLGPSGSPTEFLGRVLTELDVTVDCPAAERARLPAAGPCVFVSNHPYGGLDGVVLASLIGERRGDLRILANELLCRIPELDPMVLPLDVFSGGAAVFRNLKSLRRARDWLADGRSLLLFPAGEVSHLHASLGGVIDPPWRESAAWLLAQVPECRVVPLYVEGVNSAAFQVAGLLHPLMRTAMLPREMLNKSGRRIRVVVGEPLGPGLADRIEGLPELTRCLRMQTYLLPAASPPCGDAVASADAAAAVEPVACASDGDVLTREIEARVQRGVLASSGDLVVVHVNGAESAAVLHEIGRLRELTFRAVGEGTGRSIDVDRFDHWYEHLVLWDTRARCIAGAYRLGRVDRVLARHGRDGLYTSTLFEYRDLFLPLLGPAIEVGRSWVRAEYQRSFAPLLLLWKGIGAFLLRHPGYRSLFGAVSISGRYDPRALQLAVEYLRHHHGDPILGGLVRARAPFRRAAGTRLLRREIATLTAPEAVDAVLESLGRQGEGLPVLVRQYLKLGGRMLSFNVDAAFGNSVDCLVSVDLRRTPPNVLARYMGRDGAASFLAAQRGNRSISALR